VTDYVNFLLLGLGNGAVFAALAVALVVTYRSSGVLNFATGAVSLYAAYTYAYLRKGELLILLPPFPKFVDVGGPWPFLPAFAVSVLLTALLGLVLYGAVFRPLRHAVPVAKAVASLGVMVVLTALVAERAGNDQVLAEDIFPTHAYHLGGVRLSGDRLWFAVAIVALALALAALYRFTRFGMRTRASAETEVGALVTGLSPERMALANWAISAAVAAVAGILIAPLTPLLPGTYTLFIVPALAAAVVAQFSAIGPAVLAGLAIGMLQSLAVFLPTRHSWIPHTGAAELVPLIIVFVLLVVRGRPLPTRGMLIQHSLGRAPRPHRVVPPLVLGAVAGGIAIVALDGSYRAALTVSFILAILSLSLVVVTGYVGQISLAQLTLAGVAGFLLSTLTDSWSVPFPIAPLLAAAGATVIGVVVGLPALRIRGLLVGIVTLMFAVAIEAVWFRNDALSGGSGGRKIGEPKLFGLDLGIGTGTEYPRAAFGLLCLAVLLLVGLFVARLRTSRLGSAMLAVRANERSAAAAGISVVRVKLAGFAIAAFIAGIGGSLLAYKQQNVTFQSFSALAGLQLFATAYLAGITSVAGGVAAGLIGLGGLMFVFFDQHFDVGNWYGILSGVGVILTVIVHPEGVVGTAHEFLDKRRQARVASMVEPAPTAERPPPASHVALPEDRRAALSIEALSVRYGGVVAVDGVTFEVKEGEIVGLIGPNGAGKTTLMEALGGFIDYRGTVSFFDEALEGRPPHRRAHLGLGRTFQGIDLYDGMSVAENVVVGEYVATDATDLDAVLSDLGLLQVRDRNVGELSRGQQQLVSVARALAGHPRVLLLDEPAAGLDTTESLQLAERLRQVRDKGVTILLVDHDMSLVLGLCDTIHVLDFGVLIASGPPAEIRSDRRVAEAYLGGLHAKALVPR